MKVIKDDEISAEIEEMALPGQHYDYHNREWAEYTLEQHDLYSFEAKINYHLQTKSPKNRYLLDIFFFIPRALRISEESYPKEKFFADLNNYIRFRSPKLSISGLINDKNELSPIYKITKNLKQIENGVMSLDIIESTIYELKLLGCIIRSNLIRQINYFINMYRRHAGKKSIYAEFENFIELVQKLRKKLAYLRKEFTNINLP